MSAPTLPGPTVPVATDPPREAPSEAQVETRVEGLLARLRLDEKLGQMMMGERASTTPDDVRATLGAPAGADLQQLLLRPPGGSEPW